jgi:hypothetical protein
MLALGVLRLGQIHGSLLPQEELHPAAHHLLASETGVFGYVVKPQTLSAGEDFGEGFIGHVAGILSGSHVVS